MPSLKLDKLMARLFARAGNSTLTLNRNDLEVINKLVIEEVTRYEAKINELENLNKAFADALPRQTHSSGGYSTTTATGGYSSPGGTAPKESIAQAEGISGGPQNTPGGV